MYQAGYKNIISFNWKIDTQRATLPSDVLFHASVMIKCPKVQKETVG